MYGVVLCLGLGGIDGAWLVVVCSWVFVVCWDVGVWHKAFSSEALGFVRVCSCYG